MGLNNVNPEYVCTPMEFYAHIKDLIKIETDLVDKRLNILLLIQGALMSAHTYSEVLSIKVGVIIVASLTTVTMFFTLKRNAYSIAFILRHWDLFLEGKNLRNTAFPPVWAGSVPVPDFFDKWDDMLFRRYGKYFNSYRTLPIMFLVGWVILLIIDAVQMILWILKI